MVTVQVYPDSPSADNQRALGSWLRSESQLRGRVKPVMATGLTPGQMGAGIPDVLLVAVGSGGALAVLVQSVAGWLAQRSTDVTVRLSRPDGWLMEVDVRRARDPAEVAAVIRAATGAVEGG